MKLMVKSMTAYFSHLFHFLSSDSVFFLSRLKCGDYFFRFPCLVYLFLNLVFRNDGSQVYVLALYVPVMNSCLDYHKLVYFM